MRAQPQYGFLEDTVFVLGLVKPCPTNGCDASSEVVSYREVAFRPTTEVIIRLDAIKSSVGRVKFNGDHWGIIDRPDGMVKPSFVVTENEEIVDV